MRGAAVWGICQVGVACDTFFGFLICKHECNGCKLDYQTEGNDSEKHTGSQL